MSTNAIDLTNTKNVKRYLGIQPGVTTDDELLQDLITSQSQWFITQVGRNIASQTYTEAFSGDDQRIRRKTYISPYEIGTLSGQFEIGHYGFAMSLKNTPVISITSVTIDGTVVPVATNMGQQAQTDGYVFFTDIGRIELLGFRFTLGVKNCVVIYTAGYAQLPFDVIQAINELVAWRYKERDRIGQVSKSVGNEVIAFQTYAMPQSVNMVIDRYRRVQV